MCILHLQDIGGWTGQFQVLNSHMWPVATMLHSAGLEPQFLNYVPWKLALLRGIPGVS